MSYLTKINRRQVGVDVGGLQKSAELHFELAASQKEKRAKKKTGFEL